MTPSLTQLQAIEDPKLEIPGLVMPPGTALRPFQKVDVVYSLIQKRIMIAEYTGAGKSLIAIATFLMARHLGIADTCLFLTTGDAVDQMVEEFNLYAPDVTTVAYRGTTKYRATLRGTEPRHEVWVATHQTAANDAHKIMNRNRMIVVDEASIIRNPETFLQPALAALCAPTKAEQALYFKMLHEQGKFNFVPTVEEIPREPAEIVMTMTATPYETGPMNVWSCFRVQMGSRSPLGYNHEWFERTFCNVERKKVKMTRKDGSKVTVRLKKVKSVKEHLREDMKARIAPHYIRHPWDVVSAFLPRVQTRPIWLPLTKGQQEVYDELEEGRLIPGYLYTESGKRIEERQISAAIKLHYQLRCCDGLYALPNHSKNDSSKMKWIAEMLRGELSTEKVIVFSLRYSNLNRVEQILGYDGTPFCRIDGHPSRSDEDNTKARRDFMDPKGPNVLLITPKAARALNLQVANHMICVNVQYNPKFMEQLFGRIARPKKDGSLEPVIAYLLGCLNTVEEDLWPLAQGREEEAGDIFGNRDEFFKSMTPKQQQALKTLNLLEALT